MVIHAKRFAGHIAVESLGGPDVTEEYEPLCGADGDDDEITSSRDWKEETCDCPACKTLLTKTSK